MTAQTGNKMAASREPKVGDVVHVRMTVASVRDGYVWGPCDPVRVADIVHIEPAPLKVGDRVHAPHPMLICGYEGELLLIDGDRAWVKTSQQNAVKLRLSDLTRIEASDGAGS